MRLCIALAVCAAWLSPAPGRAQDRDVALTVYTNGPGLVREVRPLDIARGRSRVRLPGIAPQMDPTSVRVRSVTAPDRISVLEQRFGYDLIGSDRVLARYINRDVELEISGSDLPVRGRLLSLSGEVTLMGEDGGIDIIRRDTIRRIRLPELPGGLVTEPTLEWLIDNTGRAGTHRMEISYLTEGLSWHAEYTSIVDARETGMTLSGWASIDNRSGMTFENASLTLVAGEVHRTAPQPRPRALVRRTAAETLLGQSGGPAQQFDRQQVFEYHTYNLDRRATIGNNAVVQLAMLKETKVQATRQYLYDGARTSRAVQTRLTFENRARRGLGIPLPRGTVRLYQEDEGGARRFIGEDRLRDLAKDETAHLTVGNAFNLAGERVQTNVRPISNRSREESYRVVLRNHKKEQAEVRVVEHLSAPSWVIRDASRSYEKQDARTITFDVPVPAGGEATVTYTVRYQW